MSYYLSQYEMKTVHLQTFVISSFQTYTCYITVYIRQKRIHLSYNIV